MFKCIAEYYNQQEPITDYQFVAWTKFGALKKAFKYQAVINAKHEQVYWMQLWFRKKKIFGNGNKILFNLSRKRAITL